jgi:hypothetical protein
MWGCVSCKSQSFRAEKNKQPKACRAGLPRTSHLCADLIVLGMAQGCSGNGTRRFDFGLGPVLDEYRFAAPFDCQHLALEEGRLERGGRTAGGDVGREAKR